jgi:cytidine deaminase
MKTEEHIVRLLQFDSADEMDSSKQDLLNAAAGAAEHAYAPYSGYKVGAALMLENGIVLTGNNQENASFPAGICAERSALFFAGSQYPGVKILSVAVTTLFPAAAPVAPCGICRQALIEYEMKQDSPIELLMTHPGGKVTVSESIANILPMAFRYKK